MRFPVVPHSHTTARQALQLGFVRPVVPTRQGHLLQTRCLIGSSEESAPSSADKALIGQPANGVEALLKAFRQVEVLQADLEAEKAKNTQARSMTVRLAESRILNIGAQIAALYKYIAEREVAHATGTAEPSPLTTKSSRFAVLSSKYRVLEKPPPWALLAEEYGGSSEAWTARLDELVTSRNEQTHPPDLVAFTAEVDSCIADLQALEQLGAHNPEVADAAILLRRFSTDVLPRL